MLIILMLDELLIFFALIKRLKCDYKVADKFPNNVDITFLTESLMNLTFIFLNKYQC